ncbi:MAG: leucine--tRNA ligase, partial [Clostridia bacterium]|nr:leucine--tRNA ligase [Clostridia bacterium]
RCDTIFGVTFMVIAPEHPIIEKYRAQIKNIDALDNYKAECAKKTEFERTQLVKDKTGVRIDGLVAVNPANGKEIPIYISDYVMMGYGTGAIMAVPAHDERDYAFAKKFGIEIIPVIEGGNMDEGAYTGDGKRINSQFLDGISVKKDAIDAMLKFLGEKGLGEKGVQYKMKDWAFNRQRYWGEPIPIVHCPHCGMVGVPYEELPLRLPRVENFAPGEGGESPLAKIDSFVNCKCPTCGADAKRETDTMPQWAGSSWYFLRYIDPHNDKVFADPDKLKYWLPVDWYNGGMEHVTRHLIYSRFWHRFLYDIGEVPVAEPYAKRTAQGLILGPDGEKMSKSRGNVVDPNDVVDDYGADVLRVYILFMGDYGSSAPWNKDSVKGCKRFLDRVAGLTDLIKPNGSSAKIESAVHKTIKKVTSDIEEMKFNTAIASMMTLLNEIYDAGSLGAEDFSVIVRLLCPFAPHLCEELWEFTGNKTLCSVAPWPTFDDAKTVDDTVEIALQINGKFRGTMVVAADLSKDELLSAAKADEKMAAAMAGKTVVKEIVVPGKIVNIVVK